MVVVGFYKAPGNFFDKVVRLVTKSNYSHCEIFDITERRCLGYTSSPRDGGVVIREIKFKPEHWDLVEVDWVNDDLVLEFIREHLGEPYDWSSIFFSHFLRLGWHQEGKWICSEIIAEAFELDRAWTISPERLHKIIMERNKGWQ